jgi:hypothetical protein
MIKIINWLSQHRSINILLAITFFLVVVALHDTVTVLAIQLRKKLSIDGYNLFFILLFGFLFLTWIGWLLLKIRQSGAIKNALIFLLPTIVLMVLFFIFMQTYSIEAVHFFQYAFLAILLFPFLKSYARVIVWATLLGSMDELYQYVILTPDFNYFDLNDILLNLLGAGLSGVTIFFATRFRTSANTRKSFIKRSAVILAVTAIIGFIAFYTKTISWYPGFGENAAAWFSVNRSPSPGSFWTEAYKGKFIHIIGPWEGLMLCMGLFTYYYQLDLQGKKSLT